MVTIGQIAKRTNVSVETIRYYEQRGLLPEPKRRPFSGYRLYDEGAIKQLRFIKRTQELGFSLTEILELLFLTACRDVKEKSIQKINELNDKIQTLKKMKQALERLVKTCKIKGYRNECPIVDALEKDE